MKTQTIIKGFIPLALATCILACKKDETEKTSGSKPTIIQQITSPADEFIGGYSMNESDPKATAHVEKESGGYLLTYLDKNGQRQIQFPKSKVVKKKDMESLVGKELVEKFDSDTGILLEGDKSSALLAKFKKGEVFNYGLSAGTTKSEYGVVFLEGELGEVRFIYRKP